MGTHGPLLAAGSATATETVIEPRLTDTDDGDHDRFAHYVRKADIVRSAVEGVPVIALCGKKWIPNRDPEKYPVCPTCKEIYEALKAAGR
jgi:glutaredoxin